MTSSTTLLHRLVDGPNPRGRMGIDKLVVAQAISDWMDGDSIEKVAKTYGLQAHTVMQWVSGENRAHILYQVEKARRRAGLPVRYPRNIE